MFGPDLDAKANFFAFLKLQLKGLLCLVLLMAVARWSLVVYPAWLGYAQYLQVSFETFLIVYICLILIMNPWVNLFNLMGRARAKVSGANERFWKKSIKVGHTK